MTMAEANGYGNGPTLSQMVKNYTQYSNIVQNGQIWSQIVLNGPKR